MRSLRATLEWLKKEGLVLETDREVDPRLQVAAITHRKDRPIYDPLIVHGYDNHNIDVICREACFFELAERISPGFCVDTHVPICIPDWGGVIFQVKKRRAKDEGYPKNILASALSYWRCEG